MNYRNVADNNDRTQYCVKYVKEAWLGSNNCETRDNIFFFSTTGALYWNDFANCLYNSNNNNLKIGGSSCQEYVVSDTEWAQDKPHQKDLIFRSLQTSKYFKRSADKKKLEFSGTMEKGWTFHNADPSANCKFSFIFLPHDIVYDNPQARSD